MKPCANSRILSDNVVCSTRMPLNAPRTYTVSGATVAGLLGYLRGRGIDLRPSLRALGLAGVDLSEPECRVSSAVNDALWAQAEERTGEADFGLRFAQVMDLDSFHLVGHLAASSRTLGEGLDRVVQFSRLLHDAGRTELEQPGDGRMLLFPGCRGLPTPPPRQIAEFNTASAVVLVRFVTGRPSWRPQAVSFHHRTPDDTHPHRALFGVAPTFGAAEDVIVLAEADRAMPVRVTTLSRLGQYLESYAQTLLTRLPTNPDSLEEQVLRSIVSSLTTGGLTVEVVAARLGLTSRTLQRRLAQTGRAFSDLVEQARQVTAEHYLADPSLSLAEVSYLLGFREPSTFHKAFRRWTGKAPGAWREQKLARKSKRLSRQASA